MKKTFFFIFAAFSLLQSCYTYKTVTTNDIKAGKLYEIQLNNKQKIEAVCHKVMTDSISFKVNDNLVTFPKNEIEHSERKKVSVLKLAGGLAAATVGTILVIENGKQDTLLDAVTN
nr:hypothetical protein [Allomuricauda sp.]